MVPAKLPSQILSIVEDECLESLAIEKLPYVKTMRMSEPYRMENSLEDLHILMRQFKDEHPDPPPFVYVFSHSSNTAFTLKHIFSLLYDNPTTIVFFEVKQGSFIPDKGRVVSYLRISSKASIDNEKLHSLGKVDTRRINMIIASFILLRSIERPIYLSMMERFVQRILDKRKVGNRTRNIWKFCISNGLAEVTTGKIVDKNLHPRSINVIKSTDAGVAWALGNQNLATEDINYKMLDELFSEMEDSGEFQDMKGFVSGKDVLVDLCPVIKENKSVMSLYAGNIISPRDSLIVGVPSPCVFGFLNIKKPKMKKLLEEKVSNLRSNPNKECSETYLRLVAAQDKKGDHVIVCANPKDLKSIPHESPENVIERLDLYEFTDIGKCPFMINEICTVASPAEILERLKKVPPLIKRLKLRSSS